jgi:uncharacterized protein
MQKVSFLFFLLILVNNYIKGQNTKIIQNTKSQPFILGNVDTIPSIVLSEKRILNIYLPEGYSTDSAKTYPVIYLIDGSAKEYFIHVVGLVHFFNFPWVNRLPKSIVVGIANVNRNRDLTFCTTSTTDFYTPVGLKKEYFPVSGGSEKFISFIETELQPYIEKKYKVNSSKTIIGQSLGGLLATEILLKKPYLFDTYLIMSPSLWWDSESLLSKASDYLKNNLKNKVRVYIGVSNEVKVMKNDVMLLTKKTKKSGRRQNTGFL